LFVAGVPLSVKVRAPVGAAPELVVNKAAFTWNDLPYSYHPGTDAGTVDTAVRLVAAFVIVTPEDAVLAV
jgi:hypothetical protein